MDGFNQVLRMSIVVATVRTCYLPQFKPDVRETIALNTIFFSEKRRGDAFDREPGSGIERRGVRQRHTALTSTIYNPITNAYYDNTHQLATT